jgi:hypothetical protein
VEPAFSNESDLSGTDYRLFRSSSVLQSELYRKFQPLYRYFRAQDTETPRIREPKDAPILVIGSTETFERIRAQGYGNVSRDTLRGSPWRAIVLGQTIQAEPDPLSFLRALRSQLQRGGRIYISTPNLESIWLKYYGPVWSQWHPSVNRMILSPRGLRQLAGRTGFRIAWLRSRTPPGWLLSSDELAVRGLGGVGWLLPCKPDDPLQHLAEGASVASATRWNWRHRGDCLQACLVRSTGSD